MSLHLPHVSRSVVVDILTGKRVIRTITTIDGVSLKEDSELTATPDKCTIDLIKKSIEQDDAMNELLNST